MEKKIFSSLSLVLSCWFLFACERKEGPQGPIGPKGETGAQGPSGAQGVAGTANVIYSDWLAFSAPTNSTNNRKNFGFSAPKITQEIIDKGLVYCYIKHSGGGVHLLPYADKYVYSNGEVAGSILSTTIINVGSISFNQDWITPGSIPTNFANANTVQGGYTALRYIIIPGAQKARMQTLDYKNYEEVKAYFGFQH